MQSLSTLYVKIVYTFTGFASQHKGKALDLGNVKRIMESFSYDFQSFDDILTETHFAAPCSKCFSFHGNRFTNQLTRVIMMTRVIIIIFSSKTRH